MPAYYDIDQAHETPGEYIRMQIAIADLYARKTNAEVSTLNDKTNMSRVNESSFRRCVDIGGAYDRQTRIVDCTRGVCVGARIVGRHASAND